MIKKTKMQSQAEEKKNQGNEEFKKSNFQAAIRHYSDSLGKSNNKRERSKSLESSSEKLV